MRKIIVFNHITLDGFFAGPHGELDWPQKDDGESVDLAREGRTEVDTYIFGRRTFEMMASYWPTPAAREQNQFFAGILNSSRKIVFSRTLAKTDWPPTQIVREIDREMILGWKREPGKNMMIFGSGTIVQQLAKLGMIDEYQLVLNPVVLGRGKPLFTDTPGRLELAYSRTFGNGNVLLVYHPAVIGT